MLKVPFWINEPSILLNKNNILNLWPLSSLEYEEKLNSITRLIIIITILGYIITRNVNMLFIGIISILIIICFYKIKNNKKEGYKNNEYNKTKNTQNSSDTTTNPVTFETVLKSEFKLGDKKNPFSNVLLTDINDNPKRKEAPPAFNPDIHDNITKNTKSAVQMLNPEIKHTNKQLFSSLTDNFNLEQSNRTFFSNPNTKIPNDQGAFAEYLYGNINSCKDGDVEACIKNNYRHTLY